MVKAKTKLLAAEDIKTFARLCAEATEKGGTVDVDLGEGVIMKCFPENDIATLQRAFSDPSFGQAVADGIDGLADSDDSGEVR